MKQGKKRALPECCGVAQRPGTVKVRYRGLHRFCSWLVEEGELTANPMSTLSAPTLKTKARTGHQRRRTGRAAKACTGKDFTDRRDEALIRFLLDCGVRISEACGLRVDQLDLDQGMAIVKGKGSKVRPVYFGARTARALDRYVRMRERHRWAHLDALFLTQRGALSPDGARDRVKIRGVMAGIDDLHPHRFRHTVAHDSLMSGGQERDLKRLAGWSSDVMLERYGASAADARAKAAAQRLKGETGSDRLLAQHNLEFTRRRRGAVQLLQSCSGDGAIQRVTAVAFVFMNNPETLWSVGIVTEDWDIRVPRSLTVYQTQTSCPTPLRACCGMPTRRDTRNNNTSPPRVAMSQICSSGSSRYTLARNLEVSLSLPKKGARPMSAEETRRLSGGLLRADSRKLCGATSMLRISTSLITTMIIRLRIQRTLGCRG
jgi:site-specific recombinase XerC